MGDPGHAHFGIAHRRRRIAVHGTEIALPVHQYVTQGKMLGHTYNGVVNGRISVRVIFTDYVTDDTGGFLVGLVVIIAHLVHCEQDAPVDGFQAIAHVRQGPADDNAHRVIHVGLTHLVFNVYRHYRPGDFVSHSSL